MQSNENLAGISQSDEDIQRNKKNLSDLSFEVTQNQGTEPPFQNEYWDHKEEGVYVDIVSGEPLLVYFGRRCLGYEEDYLKNRGEGFETTKSKRYL